MTPQGFAILARLLRDGSGLAIGPDKLYLLETRLAPILRAHRLPDLDALALRLRDGGTSALAMAVIEAMTTNETSFFRDEKPFAHVRTQALPRLHAARPAGAKLRLWSAAASSGQEAYSLAMVVHDLRPLLGGREVEIVGTDLAQPPLVRAREGLYTQFEVQRGLPVHMLLKHFRKEGEMWRIAKELRAMASFRVWNLLDDLRPLGQFDIVFCRNVLLYFDPPTRTRVLEAVAAQMAPDGLLYLGGSETVLGVSERFITLPGDRGVYALAGALVGALGR
jgi:chemotaxis protein methyltransferase CheR